MAASASGSLTERFSGSLAFIHIIFLKLMD